MGRRPGGPGAPHDVGEVLVELGQTARARVRFEEVLGGNPPVEVARSVRARLIALYRKDGMSRKLVETLTAEAAVSEDRAALFELTASISKRAAVRSDVLEGRQTTSRLIRSSAVSSKSAL